MPRQDKLFLLGDFTAHVGHDSKAWCTIIGHHGIGKENSNGDLLLRTCSKCNLVITNTFSNSPTNTRQRGYIRVRSTRTIWTNYVIARQCNLQNIKFTCVMRGCGSWSDHQLVRCTTSIVIRPKQRQQSVMPVLSYYAWTTLDINFEAGWQSLADTVVTDDTESSWQSKVLYVCI